MNKNKKSPIKKNRRLRRVSENQTPFESFSRDGPQSRNIKPTRTQNTSQCDIQQNNYFSGILQIGEYNQFFPKTNGRRSILVTPDNSFLNRPKTSKNTNKMFNFETNCSEQESMKQSYEKMVQKLIKVDELKKLTRDFKQKIHRAKNQPPKWEEMNLGLVRQVSNQIAYGKQKTQEQSQNTTTEIDNIKQAQYQLNLITQDQAFSQISHDFKSDFKSELQIQSLDFSPLELQPNSRPVLSLDLVELARIEKTIEECKDDYPEEKLSIKSFSEKSHQTSSERELTELELMIQNQDQNIKKQFHKHQTKLQWHDSGEQYPLLKLQTPQISKSYFEIQDRYIAMAYKNKIQHKIKDMFSLRLSLFKFDNKPISIPISNFIQKPYEIFAHQNINKFNFDLEFHQKSKKNPKKLQFKAIKNAQIEQIFNNKCKIMDIAWNKSKNNKKCFINTLKPISQDLQEMDINEIVIKQDVQKVLLEINWLQNNKKFKNKKTENQLEQSINEKGQEVIQYQMMRSEQIIPKISNKYEGQIRTTPVFYEHNKGCCSLEMMDLANSLLINFKNASHLQFKNLNQINTFKEFIGDSKKYDQQYFRRILKKIGHDKRNCINKLFFKQTYRSLYSLMYDLSFDISLHLFIDNLFLKYRKIFVEKLFARKRETKQEVKWEQLEVTEKLLFRSLDLEGMLKHNQINFEIFKRDGFDARRFLNSDRDFVPREIEYRRMNALTNQTKLKNNLIGFQEIELKNDIEKDTMNLNCKQLEPFFNNYDCHINPLKKHFGYKSYYMRIPSNLDFIFEIFIVENLFFSQVRTSLVQKSGKSSNLKTLFQNQQNQKNNELYNSLETDISMQEVNWADIQCLEEDFKKDQIKAKAVNILKKIGVVTAAEHYKKLKLLNKYRVSKDHYETKFEQDLEAPPEIANPMSFLKKHLKINYMIHDAKIYQEDTIESYKVSTLNSEKSLDKFQELNELKNLQKKKRGLLISKQEKAQIILKQLKENDKSGQVMIKSKKERLKKKPSCCFKEEDISELCEIMTNTISLRNSKKLKEIFHKNNHMHHLVSYLDSNGDSFVSHAVKIGDWKSLMILLASGFDAHVGNSNGDTPLHISIKFDRKFCTDLLLNHGCDETVLNKQGMTPWQMQK